MGSILITRGWCKELTMVDTQNTQRVSMGSILITGDWCKELTMVDTQNTKSQYGEHTNY